MPPIHNVSDTDVSGFSCSDLSKWIGEGIRRISSLNHGLWVWTRPGGLGCLLKGTGARPMLNETFGAADTKEGGTRFIAGRSAVSQPGRRYGSNGME
jgi:hypothetical protein